MFGVIVKEDQQICTQYKLLLLPCLVTQSLTVGLYCWGQHILNIRFGGLHLECPARGPVLILFEGVMQTIKGEKSMDLPSCNTCKPQDAAWRDTLVVQYWLFDLNGTNSCLIRLKPHWIGGNSHLVLETGWRDHVFHNIRKTYCCQFPNKYNLAFHSKFLTLYLQRQILTHIKEASS